MKKLFEDLFKHKLRLFTVGLGLLLLLGSNLYLIRAITLLDGIENQIRMIAMGIIAVLFIIVFISAFRVILSKKKPRYIILMFFIVIGIGINYFAAHNISVIYSKISALNNEYVTYKVSLVALKDNKADISLLKDSDIGILDKVYKENDYLVATKVTEEFDIDNKLVPYSGYLTILEDLYNGKIDYAFLPTDFVSMFKEYEGYENIETETAVIYTGEHKVKKESSTKSTNEPFSILIMGVDSYEEDISGANFNGDSLILVTFNPETLNATMLSIPRDTYVPIQCFPGKRHNKITHAAWYGEDCMIDTIEAFTEVPIDYYVLINFNGVIKLVDALGGVDVDVPLSFCEDNVDKLSKVCLEPGYQHITGEEALALARHRKTTSDFERSKNQQMIISALLNNVKDIRSIDTLYEVLDTVGVSMDTNMPTSTMLSFYNIGKEVLNRSKNMEANEIISIEKLAITGYDRILYDYDQINDHGMKLSIYSYIPYQGSINDVKEAMQANLGIISKEDIKSIEFDVNNPYIEKVIGAGNYDESFIKVLPDFSKMTYNEVLNYGSNNNIKITVIYDSTDQVGAEIGDIINQSITKGADIRYINSVTVTIADEIIITEEVNSEEDNEEEIISE